MTKHFELDRNPAGALEYFPTGRTYTREQPNALTARQVRVFLATMKRMFPQHYAMVFFGFISGARPSTLRPLRREGEVTDLKWDERVLLLRRSNTLGDEIMDETKTALDQEIPLPPLAVHVLRAHVAGLPEGPMRASPYLFTEAAAGPEAGPEKADGSFPPSFFAAASDVAGAHREAATARVFEERRVEHCGGGGVRAHHRLHVVEDVDLGRAAVEAKAPVHASDERTKRLREGEFDVEVPRVAERRDECAHPAGHAGQGKPVARPGWRV